MAYLGHRVVMPTRSPTIFDRLRSARPRKAPASPAYRRSPEVTIRWATADDEPKLKLLSELDEAPIPPSPVLLGLVGEELWVAASLSDGAVISDPFRQSSDVAALVIERGRQLTVPSGTKSGRVRLAASPLAVTGGSRRS